MNAKTMDKIVCTVRMVGMIMLCLLISVFLHINYDSNPLPSPNLTSTNHSSHSQRSRNISITGFPQ